MDYATMADVHSQNTSKMSADTSTDMVNWVCRIPIMFLEFKDRAFNAATVSQVSDVVKRLRLEKYVALFLVSDSQQEQLVSTASECVSTFHVVSSTMSNDSCRC